MEKYPSTVIIRHRRENLKKCSLRGLETRNDIFFIKYPYVSLPPLHGYIVLALDGPVLSKEDEGSGLVLLDATWRYASIMLSVLQSKVSLPLRSLPPNWRTAYPRRQNDCSDSSRGLASIEALFIAYYAMNRSLEGLLDHYHWKEEFLRLNAGYMQI